MEEIEIDFRKSPQENASAYYERAKRAREKAKRLADMIDKGVRPGKAREAERKKGGKKKWHEHFRWFYSGSGYLVVAGKNASQNERIYKSVMKDDDLFLHAEIVGAPFTVIKKGINADDKTVREAAQFAGSYSRAWKFGYASVDVYAVGKGQLTKKASGEYVKKGGVIILGERKWYRNTPLGLSIGTYGGKPACFPLMCAHLLKKAANVVPGGREKEDISTEISKVTGLNADEIMQLLPAGESDIVK